MPDASKPLFSRPALAAVMLLSTLAIWLLNLTAPSTNLPTPNIKTWWERISARPAFERASQ